MSEFFVFFAVLDWWSLVTDDHFGVGILAVSNTSPIRCCIKRLKAPSPKSPTFCCVCFFMGREVCFFFVRFRLRNNVEKSHGGKGTLPSFCSNISNLNAFESPTHGDDLTTINIAQQKKILRTLLLLYPIRRKCTIVHKMSHKLCSFVAYNSFYFPSIISTYTSSSTSTLYKGNEKRIWARCYYRDCHHTLG